MIVVLGATGYVGQAFSTFLEKRGLAHVGLSRTQVDYTSVTTLKAWIEEHQPDFLINAAGYTGKPNVDACENDKANCLFGNAVLPGIIADVCGEYDLSWGQISSGCIYTGSKPDGSGFTEEDEPNFHFRTNNCSFYSGTKALGEEVLRDAPNCYVWRIRIPFNHIDGPRNYLSKLMRYERLLDATNSISQLDESVEAMYSCYAQQVPFGTYNVTNPGQVTTRDVVALIEQHGLAPHAFSFFDNEEDFMNTAAKTPRSNCTMDSRKLSSVGIQMTPVHEAISQALNQWIPEEGRS